MLKSDYQIFHDVQDYPHKAGVLVKSKLMNNFHDLQAINFKMEISQEIFEVPELLNDIDALMEKQATLLVTMYKHFLEIKEKKNGSQN